MPRYKLTIEYDGTPFSGWQIQANGPSIQGELARAIEGLCGKHVVPRGAGRTDAGVHARGQVAHFDLEREYNPETVAGALNGLAAFPQTLTTGDLAFQPVAAGPIGGDYSRAP